MNLGTTNALNYLVIAALAVWVVTRQLRARPVVARQLFVLPVILVVLGIGSLNSAVSKSGAHFSTSDATWLAIDLAATIVFGVIRGTSIRLYPEGGVLWRKGTLVTLAGWVLSFAVRGGIGVLASDHGAKAVASSALALSFGVSLAVQGAVVYLRGLREGTPFAADPRRARAW
ncbi:MAG TPA: hypothetical protein VME20_01340 [Acidimicrobiales bacterium]|nr:hypothetical protein [Acidimicrobiales bacterium]